MMYTLFTKSVSFHVFGKDSITIINKFTLNRTLQVLKEENWDENYKSHEDYRDVVYDKMVEGLKTLPEQYPPRVNFQKSHIISYLIYNSLLLCLIQIIHIQHSLLSLLILITGFFSVNYPTMNNKFLNHLIIIYTSYIIVNDVLL